MDFWDAVNPMNAFDNEHLDPLNISGNNSKPNTPIDYNSMPKYPGFDSLLDKDGNLPANYKVNAGQYYDPAVRAELNRRALGGQSAWAKMALGRQGLDESRAVQNAGAQASGNTAQARAALAMRGGSTSGARERIATSGMRDRMMATQDARNQGASARLDIMGKDADRGDQAINMNNSIAQQMMQGDEYNTTNQVNEKRAGDMAKINEYNEKMKGWASGQQATATENAGKK